MNFIQKIGGRKFISALASVASCSALVAAGKIDPGVYSAVMIATVGAYIIGNVAQKAVVKPAAE